MTDHNEERRTTENYLSVLDQLRTSDDPESQHAYRCEMDALMATFALNAFGYQAYLGTDHWKRMREVALVEADNRCQVCNSDKRLAVHHRSYKHLGTEHLALNDLTVLCNTCHHRHHKNT